MQKHILVSDTRYQVLQDSLNSLMITHCSIKMPEISHKGETQGLEYVSHYVQKHLQVPVDMIRSIR